ncbi:MAG TPA: phosphatase PAP2 family protein [Bradyrhizobium sp.]|nr:phosphatase PAP2 family protein [Bradyrhizobium sp.]
MGLYRIPPTRADIAIADTISKHASRGVEKAAQVLTWGADENLMLALAAGWWVYCRNKSPRARVGSNHILLSVVAVSALPHLIKSIVDQERPNRMAPRGHLHGVPVSGNPYDAFPSGHAMHIGALASAATVLPPARRNLIWALGAGVALTRIVLLAHWASDVAAGLALGALTERLLRPLTGFGSRRNR